MSCEAPSRWLWAALEWIHRHPDMVPLATADITTLLTGPNLVEHQSDGIIVLTILHMMRDSRASLI